MVHYSVERINIVCDRHSSLLLPSDLSGKAHGAPHNTIWKILLPRPHQRIRFPTNDVAL